MKKIVLLTIVVAMLALCFSVPSFAANTFALSDATTAVGDGTADVTVNLTYTPNGTEIISYVQLNFLLPTGVTLKAADTSAFSALFSGTAYDENNFAEGQVCVYEDSAATEVSAPFTVVLTFTVDNTAANVYTIEMDELNTIISDSEFNNMLSTFPTATITVEAASSDNTVTVNDTKIASENASTAIPGATGGEYGSAFRISFTTPDTAIDGGVVFGLTTDGGKRYLPKRNILAGIGTNSQVTLDVSFLNGSTAAGKAGTIAPLEISGVSVILSDGLGNFFYSDESDANYKE